VAVPSEHGGWGLTLEPVLLGLLVARSWPGLAIGIAAFGAFLVRTPLKLTAVDARRSQWRDRSRLAARIATGELVLIVGLAVVATATAGWRWWVPVSIAVPLVAIEAWYDVRSRGRRLVPEVCGALGIAGAAAAIAVAGGADGRLAAAVWLVLAARTTGAIPFVRAQIARARRAGTDVRTSDVGQVASVVVGSVAVALDLATLPALGVIALIAVLQAWWSRRPPPPVKILGVREMALGLALVAATALGVHLS
jgi:hypothetical protein